MRECPKILLIDVGKEVATTLRTQGHNVSSGSFGAIYEIEKAGGLVPIEFDGQLPQHTEQDIVVVDLNGWNMGGRYEPKIAEGLRQIWMSCELGEVDSRPLAALSVRDDFDRILDDGGIFVIFANIRRNISYMHAISRRGRLDGESILSSDWGFLSALEIVKTDRNHGKEIKIVEGEEAAPFRGYMQGGEFFCTLSLERIQIAGCEIAENDWLPIATNRYGDCVAAIVKPSEKQGRHGWIFILPQVLDKEAVISDLLSNYLPKICPRLFPNLLESRWVHDPKYEVSSILKVQAEINAVKVAAEKEVARLSSELEQLRVEHADWYALLSGTGDDLVQAVIRTLRRFGFTEVVDVDAEAPQRSQLREDIRIHDTSPILVVDVKGIMGHPEDAEAQQADKHTLMRMRDLKRTDLKALTIINSQRCIPPHERDLAAYRRDLIDNARQMGSGLMTTWDLCLIWRNMDACGWTSEEVKPIFYQNGRISVLPAHYKPLGSVDRVWRIAIRVVLTGAVSIGDTVAITSGKGEYREISVHSIRVDEEDKQRAEPNSNCSIGIEDSATIKKIKKGHLVYHVVRAASRGG